MTSLPVMGWRDKAMHIHDFDLAFCVKSKLPGWEDLSPADVLSALRKRVAELTESDVLEAVGFLATFPEDGGHETEQESESGVPLGSQTGQLANPPCPRYPAGTRIVSIFGESGDTDEGNDVQTGPNAVGIISRVFPEQENCYMAEFPGGIFAFLSDAELADSRYYQVLDGVPEAVALFTVALSNSGVVQMDSSKGEKP